MKIYDEYTCLKTYRDGDGRLYFLKGKSYKVIHLETRFFLREVCFIDEQNTKHYWDYATLKKDGFFPTKVYNTKLGRLLYEKD